VDATGKLTAPNFREADDSPDETVRKWSERYAALFESGLQPRRKPKLQAPDLVLLPPLCRHTSREQRRFVWLSATDQQVPRSGLLTRFRLVADATRNQACLAGTANPSPARPIHGHLQRN
jgi:hypothetical protein